MQIFNYKNDVYVLDGDLEIIKGNHFLDDTTGEIIEHYDAELGKTYKFVRLYDVRKGFKVIDSFKTEKEAVECIESIRAQLQYNTQESCFCDSLMDTNISHECCCAPLK